MVSITAAFLRDAGRPLLAVTGPTASGKTDASILLARALDALPATDKRGRGRTEIVNADSRQMYHGLDIGTAKITPEEMHGVPHHLLSTLDPGEETTAARYQREATQIIDDILARGNVPMLVGGSMLYLSAVLDGLDFPPVADPAMRAALEAVYDLDAGATLHARLAQRDPESAADIPRENKPYVLRAMELAEAHGTAAAARGKRDVPYDVLILGVTRPRAELVARIDARTDALLAGGWIDEVRRLRDAGYDKDTPAMKSHGYREVLAFLDGEMDAKTLRETIAAKTRQYAKRQETWWRGDPRIHWSTP